MPNALKKINARVKVLQKKHPKSKRTTLQKQAGREWKAGKLKGAVGAVRKKRKPARKKAVRRKAIRRKTRRRVGSSGNTRTATKASTSRNRTATKTITATVKIGSPRRRRRKAKKQTYRRRVSGTMAGSKSLVPILAIGGLALAAYLLLKPKTPALVQTSNAVRNANTTSIVQYATAAGLGISAITQLINALNNSDDNSVNNAAADPHSFVQANTNTLPTATIVAPTGGPSLSW